MSVAVKPARHDLIRRGLQLNYLTIGYNSLEAVVSLTAGMVSGSVALVGFGVDSVIEVTSAGASQWRFRRDADEVDRARAETVTHRIIGWTFLMLAAYVTLDSVESLASQERPDKSYLGIVILSLSVIVMPVLARAKARVARSLESRALQADATQTSVCAYLSAIALAGVALNALAGWWWADPLAALAMVPIIAKEGFEGVRATGSNSCCR